MRELSVVGPTLSPSSVCTHCLSGSCDQDSGHKEVGTPLNSPRQGLLGEVTRSCNLQKRDKRQTHNTHDMSTVTVEPFTVLCQLSRSRSPAHTRTHTHTFTSSFISVAAWFRLGRMVWALTISFVLEWQMDLTDKYVRMYSQVLTQHKQYAGTRPSFPV